MDETNIENVEWDGMFVVPKKYIESTQWSIWTYSYILGNHFIKLKYVTDTINTTVHYETNGDKQFVTYLTIIGLRPA